MKRAELLRSMDKLLQTCSKCDIRKIPYSPRSHEHRNGYCIKQCKDVGPKLIEIGKELEQLSKEERTKKRECSA
ncbi:zinc-finger domain-containing protein [Paenibacillus sp. HN-1]|uniref:zinc-finger domain-containing protein n=1 Tax=Paenibacillus TaxID=44249 RepID=UPI001CA8DCDE|nr:MULTISPECIES: zinc-finger domain-containing protein [Paenibacillus]MBY9081236.1 zinc-finger domain-containing protein [Paenibacillus sp. CGMCC 1.18879]MBY9087273.1 zinc-finger domain-containing protein [Paenibacillus sinensis]